jgi:AraC-like DNA-binding protein
MGQPTITAQFLRHVANCLELTGRSAANLLAEFGLDRDAIEGADTEIPLETFLMFFERAAVLARNPAFGLHAGRLVGSDSIGPLSFLFLSAPDLHGAFASFTRYLDTMQQASRNAFVVRGPLATFEYKVVDPALPLRRQDAEYSISAMFSLARQYTGGTIELSEVRFEHERGGHYGVYRDYFGCDVFFEQETNLLAFDAGHLSHRGRVLSPVLHPILEDHLRRRAVAGSEGTLIERIKAAIASAPLDRPPQATEIAARLHVSLATLHRRLRAAGTNWRVLLDEHRMIAAKRLLRETNRSVADVALSVGYAESASFSRAYARHFGHSPRASRG